MKTHIVENDESHTELGRPSWDQIWMTMADTISKRSRCSRAQVGCVLVSDSQSVLAVSYNGPPPRYMVTGSCSNWCPRAMGVGDLDNVYDNCPSAHAEINAIARADHSEIHGATAYVNRSSCINCAKALAASGVVRVVHRVTEDDLHRNPNQVEDFLHDCGLTVERW